MDSLRLTCLGVGDGAPSAERNHSAYLYELEGLKLLLDCGEPVARTLKALGLGWDAIDHIFLSHLHCDHFGGLFMLMQGFWVEQRRKALRVHLPVDGIKPIRQMFDAAAIFDELFEFDLRYETLQAGHSVDLGDLQVTPFPTTHLEDLRKRFQATHPRRFEAFCFLLETDRLRVGHSADLGAVTDLIPLLAKPLDLLVCELAHFHPVELFSFLKGRPVQRVVFTHLGRPHWERFEEVRQLATTMLPELEITFPRDGDVIQVDPRSG